MKVFKASPLASGNNKINPPYYEFSEQGVKQVISGIFSKEERFDYYRDIDPVTIKTRLVGFCAITINGYHVHGEINGFYKSEVKEMKELVEIGKKDPQRLSARISETNDDDDEYEEEEEEEDETEDEEVEEVEKETAQENDSDFLFSDATSSSSRQNTSASTPPPPPTFSYYAMIDNKQEGPYDKIQFKRLVDNDMVSLSTMVWKDGMDVWKKAKDVEEVGEIFPQYQAAPPQAPAVAPPAPSKTYQVSINGQNYGPFNLQQLQQYTQAGQITAQSMVWTQGMPSWLPAGSIPELASLFAPQMPGAVPPPLNS